MEDPIPLFPGGDGRMVTPQAMLAVVEELARLLGEGVLTGDGRKRFGKHSWRSTGAVYMTSLRVEVYKVQLMARWSSTVVTHYTILAPLKAIAEDFRRAVMQRRALPPADQDKNIRKIRRALDTDIKAVEDEVKSLDDAIKRVEAQMARKLYVKN